MKRLMNSCISTVLACLVLLAVQTVSAEGPGDLTERLRKVPPTHPRLFFPASATDELKAKIEGDSLLFAVYAHTLSVAKEGLTLPPLKREKVGKRLLGVSRTCLQRVSYWAFAYRMTGARKWLDRAETEMLATAAFEDWNPSHFLDVAEMTTALAIGYDWLYGDLKEETRTAVRKAIVEKGLESSFPGGSWVKGTNNWNQVCHGGLTVGALAVLEDCPELAERIIARAVENVPRAMREYEPDGVYPEGPSYWQYGTTYNVLMISALESVLGSDFGLGAANGFLKSPEFYLRATGPTGLYFNFSDCGERGSVAPAMFWFAQRMQQPSLLWREKQESERLIQEGARNRDGENRVLPFLLVWAGAASKVDAPSLPLSWKGDGPVPVAMLRSGWDADATFVGLKGGSPSENHAHMDTGSFVLDMHGVRWAIDLGSQSYNSLESRGINLWNMGQNSERWTVFRLNNRSHNTLTVDGQLQRVKGKGTITRFSDNPGGSFAILDMTPAYQGQLEHAERGVRLVDGSVLVQDEVKASDLAVTVRWAMATQSAVTIVNDREATLSQDGKKLSLRVVSPEHASLTVTDIEKPAREYDAPNPNARMVQFEVPVESSGASTFRVYLCPDGAADPGPGLTPLREW